MTRQISSAKRRRQDLHPALGHPVATGAEGYRIGAGESDTWNSGDRRGASEEFFKRYRAGGSMPTLAQQHGPLPAMS
jgi:hypothetical protein